MKLTEKYPFFMITFPSVHHALKFESKLKGTGINFQLVPVPREISSSCGVAAKVEGMIESEICDFIEKNRIEYDAVYVYNAPKQKPRLVKTIE
ncbi:DUF3343 domain-containing protein [Thermovenabulum sp.]|uniref:DUF3343 domain-containing protein n=1 Tax=Thermovenabulum sp. TaxID=3100335 RepID=UPI003C7C7220